MSATIAQPEQVQTAPATPTATPTATSPAEVITDFRDVADQLSTARMTGDTAEATRLEALIAGSPPTPPEAAAPTQTPEAPPPQVEPVEPKQEQTPTEQPATETEAETGEEPSPETVEAEAKAPRVRIHDPLDQAFQALRRAGIDPHDAHERIYGQKPQPQQATPAEAQPVSTPQIEQMEAELATIETQLDGIASSEPIYTKEIADLTRQQSRLAARIEAARVTASQEQQNNAAFIAQRDVVLADVSKTFPAMADKQSVQYRLSAQLAREAQNPAHPHHAELFKTTAPDFFAREAAKLTGANPVSPSVPQTKPAAVAPSSAQPPRPTISPAPGSKQTAPPPPQKSADELARDTIALTDAILTGVVTKPRSAHLGVLIR